MLFFLTTGHSPCIGRIVDNFSRYEWKTYNEIEQQCKPLGQLVRSRVGDKQKCVGIYAANSVEWVISQLSCIVQNLVTVPLYDTLGTESIKYSINEVEMSLMFCDNEDKVKSLLDQKDDFPYLKVFILTHDNLKDKDLAKKCKAKGTEFFTWSQALKEGEKYPQYKYDAPKPDDLFLIQYTSGTTGLLNIVS